MTNVTIENKVSITQSKQVKTRISESVPSFIPIINDLNNF